jgi:hypothetical protein
MLQAELFQVLLFSLQVHPSFILPHVLFLPSWLQQLSVKHWRLYL